MKLLATLALFGVISATEVDSLLDEDAEMWVRVSGAHMRVVCPRLHPRLNDAIRYANGIPISRPHEKALTELHNAQQTIAQRCSWNGTFYHCAPHDEQYILSQLMTARVKLGTLSRRNTSLNVVNAYNKTYWAREYATRCINAHSTLAAQVRLAENPEHDADILEQMDVDTALAALDMTEEELEMIKLSFSDNGSSIHKEVADIERLAKAIEKSGANKDIKAGVESLLKSKEMAHLKELEEAHKKTPMGKALDAAVTRALTNTGKSIKGDEHSISIENEKLPGLEKDWMAAGEVWKANEKAGHFKPFEQGLKDLENSKEAHQLEHAIKEFEKTPAAGALKKELTDLKHAFKATARWSDLPKGMDQPAVPMDEELEMIRLEFSDKGAAAKAEAEDVKKVMEAIKKSGDGKDIKAAFERVLASKEVADLKAYDDKFQKSPMGKAVHGAVGKALTHTGDSIKRHPDGFELPNEKLPALEKDWKAAEATWKAAEKDGWFKPYDEGLKDLAKSKEAGELQHAIKEFEKTPNAHALKKELTDLKHAIKNTTRWTDLPKGVEVPKTPMEEDTSFLF